MAVPSTHNQQALALPFVWAAYWVNGKISWLSEKPHARVLAGTVVPEACLSVSARECHHFHVCYPDSTELDCWYIREVFVSGSSCCC